MDMRHFVAVGGSFLWFRASSLSRGGGFLSNTRDRTEAGRNKHTPLASEVISFSNELSFGFFSPAVESDLCLGRNKNGPIFSCTSTRPRGRQSKKSHTVPTYLKKMPRGRTNVIGRLKAPARSFKTAHRDPSAIRARKMPIQGRSDLGMALKCDKNILRLCVASRAVSALALRQLQLK